MSKQAAATFISAVKATRTEFEGQVNAFYTKFIRDNGTPTNTDVTNLGEVIKKMQDVAKVYHEDVGKAMLGFGGPSDTTIKNAITLHDTLRKKIKR